MKEKTYWIRKKKEKNTLNKKKKILERLRIEMPSVQKKIMDGMGETIDGGEEKGVGNLFCQSLHVS